MTREKYIVCTAATENESLSDHFKAKEFRCKDGSTVWFVQYELLTLLEEIRVYYNAPLHINSGYRTYYWNNQIGGSTTSYHMRGAAADITVDGHKPSEVQDLLKEWCSAEGGYGIGCYQNFTHIDTRPIYTTWKE